MAKKQPKKEAPRVHDDLKGFDIKINQFGEITSNLNIEKLNEFLNEKVDDKKLRDRSNTSDDEEE